MLVHELAADHAVDALAFRKELHQRGLLLCGKVRVASDDLKRRTDQAVARKDRRCLAEGLVAGGLVPAQIVVVK